MIEYKMPDENLLVQRLELGPIATNCYIVGDKAAGELAVIDPAGDFGILQAALEHLNEEIKSEKDNITVKYIFNTHGHWDHIGANAELHEATGAPILIHKEDEALLGQGYDRTFGVRFAASKADRLLEEGQCWKLGRYDIKVLYTPGHTKGGVALVVADLAVFSGDSLFQLSIGRTDLPGGDYQELLASIRQKLFTLPDDMPVFPGHGPHTFIGDEKRMNPFLK